MDKGQQKKATVKDRLSGIARLLPKVETITKAMKRATSRIPFVDDVLAMYYCAVDPSTPKKIRIVIGATLLYLVMPLDVIPDFLMLVGYTDDVTALMVAMRLVSSHVTEAHRLKARTRLEAMRTDEACMGGAVA